MIRIGPQEIAALTRVIESGDLFRYHASTVTETEQFEAEWSAKIGVQHTLAVTSGTAALVCACAGLGIGPGDEVIVPGYTFIATAIAPLICGAIPVLAEVNDSLLLDPDDVARRISPRTKAIIPVHMQGMPCDMDGIMAVARRHKLLVIEDACQADAGSFRGQRLGAIGHAGAFSFNFYKLMTCGEGGALTTNDYDLFVRARMMHDGGSAFWPTKDQPDLPLFIGSEFRFHNLLAAMLRVQMTQVDGWIASGRASKQRLVAALRAAGVRVMPSNDLDGDCGLVLGWQYDTEAETLQCQRALAQRELNCWRPYDTGRHVYCNWTPILEHRVGHCDAVNPYLHPANQGAQMAYDPDMLPVTLDLLKRTLFLSLTPFLSEAEEGQIIDNITAAANQPTSA
ncbi:MAG TPA: DegT/DnrJ/EryC1/StrS family aminotransferase [Armatimonadota bacterium]